MARISFIFLFFILTPFYSYSQESDTTTEIWYVWMDANVEQDGSPARVIGNTAFEISCCVKSPKYRKLLKQANKWVEKELDVKVTGESVLQKIQDPALAESMLKRSVETVPENVKLIRVDFTESCK